MNHAQIGIYEAADEVLAARLRWGLTAAALRPLRVRTTRDPLPADQPPAVVVLDCRNERTSKLEEISVARERFPYAVIIAVVPSSGSYPSEAILAGADNYVFDPVNVELLAALSDSRARRPISDTAGVTAQAIGDLVVEPEAYQARSAAGPVPLTPTEYRILATLAAHAGKTLSPAQLYAAAQEALIPEGEARAILKVHIRRLRVKLAAAGVSTAALRTVRGFGYMLTEELGPVGPVSEGLGLLSVGLSQPARALVPLAVAVEHDELAPQHTYIVRQLASALGKRVELTTAELSALVATAVLHDVGKLLVPPEVLSKPTILTKTEWAVMRRHPRAGARLLDAIGMDALVVRSVAHHHERWDGEGYPAGMKREDIPTPARVFAVVDAFESMVGSRPFRQPVSEEQALREISGQAGKQFDPDVVKSFLEVIAEGGAEEAA